MAFERVPGLRGPVGPRVDELLARNEGFDQLIALLQAGGGLSAERAEELRQAKGRAQERTEKKAQSERLEIDWMSELDNEEGRAAERTDGGN